MNTQNAEQVEVKQRYTRHGRRQGERHAIEQGVTQWLEMLEAGVDDVHVDYASFEDATHISQSQAS
jgi:hypothetical protein